MNVSIIVPTYNKLPRLKLMAASLYNQTYPADKYEVIFIDDGSEDGTKEFFSHSSFPFQYKYYYQSNLGRASARNTGINLAKNEYIIFIDDDVIQSPYFIEEHMKLQRRGQCISRGKIYDLPFMKFFSDPSKGVLYRNDTHNYQGLKDKCINVSDITDNFHLIESQRRLSEFESLIMDVMTIYPGHCDWISFAGGNVCAPAKWLQDMGGFDQAFSTIWGCEDLELGYRMFLEGKPFVYNSLAINYHITHYRENYKDEHKRTSEYFYSKHKDDSVLLLNNFLSGVISKEELLKHIGSSAPFSKN